MNLQFMNNIPAAIELLVAADHEISQLEGSGLDSIRSALAQDIMHLKSVSEIDYTGLYTRLAALDEEVNNLPSRRPDSVIAPLATTPAIKTVWWQKGLQETWHVLQKMIVVRYHPGGLPPLLAPEQHVYLLQNLHDTLQQSLWAVLNKKQDIYQLSLQRAKTWIQQYFLLDASTTQNIINQLNELAAIQVNPPVLKLDASIQAFQDYFKDHNHV